MKLYLDDERQVPSGYRLVKTVKEMICFLKTGIITDISLDHDLGEVSETGYDVLLWIEKEVALNNFKSPKIKIHTANPSARVKMELAVKNIEKLSKDFA